VSRALLPEVAIAVCAVGTGVYAGLVPAHVEHEPATAAAVGLAALVLAAAAARLRAGGRRAPAYAAAALAAALLAAPVLLAGALGVATAAILGVGLACALALVRAPVRARRRVPAALPILVASFAAMVAVAGGLPHGDGHRSHAPATGSAP
jgi:hypothetical protein